MITQERLKDLFSYNAETGEFTRIKLPSKYSRQKIGEIAGSLMSDGYVSICIELKHYKAHRLAWLYVHGEWPNGDIDHVNGVKSDNRICNLRDVSVTENRHNQRRAHKTSKSGLLGATFVEYIGKYYFGRYKSSIRIGKNKRLHLGYFDTAQQAHEAYVKAKREHHSTCTI